MDLDQLQSAYEKATRYMELKEFSKGCAHQYASENVTMSFMDRDSETKTLVVNSSHVIDFVNRMADVLKVSLTNAGIDVEDHK